LSFFCEGVGQVPGLERKRIVERTVNPLNMAKGEPFRYLL
jgi:hypothetical protein